MEIGGTLVPKLVVVLSCKGFVKCLPFAKLTMSCWNAGKSVLDGSSVVGVVGAEVGSEISMVVPHAARSIGMNLCVNMRWSILI